MRPKPINFSEITPRGDLAFRAGLNFDRLEEKRYQPEKVFQARDFDWPGDTEGRVVLALALLAQATHREPKFLAAILERFPAHENEQGYFGSVSLPDLIDEQQLSGHGWVLRGLGEEYLRTKSAEVRQMMEKIVANLVLPTRGRHRDYPIDPGERSATGGHSGTHANKIGAWLLSTDIGCDFIFLDGVVQAWEIMGGAELRELIDEIIGRFLETDLLAIKAQTHATLTALRAILRYARESARLELVDEVEKRFRLYLAEAWTENFANYNWFQRPEWTEPCAIVDSLMVAVDLWRARGESKYIATAHLIYYNALGHAQRANGGFGCDSCLGAAEPVLRISVPEAYWCCTMRGGEGLARAIQYLVFQTEEALYLPFFNDCEVTMNRTAGTLKFKETTRYPYEGHVQIEITEGTAAQNVSLFLYLPPWAEQPQLFFNGQVQPAEMDSGFARWNGRVRAGDVLSYSFAMAVTEIRLSNHNSIPGYGGLRHGPLLLACDGAWAMPIKAPDISADARYEIDGAKLGPLNDVIRRPEIRQEDYVRQVLFPTVTKAT